MKNRQIYTISSTQEFIDSYLKIKDAIATQFIEGCLGLGSWILTAPGRKTIIINEVAVNSWSSAQTIRRYNKIPAKYQKILDKI